MEQMTEDELWGKLAHLLTHIAEKNPGKTVGTLLAGMRGSFVSPVALAWFVDENLNEEVRAVCKELNIPYNNEASIEVVKERGH